MDPIRFDPEMSFAEVRQLVKELNRPEHKDQLAQLTWLDGSAKDQTVTFLYDPMAERFGHTIDKASIHEEIVSSLYNGIPVEVRLADRPPKAKQA